MSSIVWFRRDLRLADNPAWAAAASSEGPVTALFIVDPKLFRSAGPHRGPQLVAHLEALDGELQKRGGRLKVAEGDPVETLAHLTAGGDRLYANRDYSPYAQKRDAAVEAEGIDVEWHDGCHVIRPGFITTGSNDPYKVFTPFYRKWQQTPWPEWPDPRDASVTSDPGAGIPLAGTALLEGGEAAARDRLETFLETVDNYPDVRDRPDLDQTSRLSPDLKFGTISPRRVASEVGNATPGREAFVRQLAWRDFYAQIMWAHPRTEKQALRVEYDKVAWLADDVGFEAWASGQTGYPIVDAGMRQLASEGWMHNRVRMITASFLVKDLLIDWRRGERHFRDLLLDADPAQNVGNWQWVAGTGADAAPYFRVFNPMTQSKKFDPDGVYIRRYVPELESLGAPAIHVPWEAPGLELAAAGITLGDSYPFPIVDHAEARLRTLEAYGAARG